MTYCIGIKTNEGVVLASDSRTNAGLDNVNIYSKMLTYDVGDRTVVIVTSGNLATSQAVFKSIEKDIKENSALNLNKCKDFEQIAICSKSLHLLRFKAEFSLISFSMDLKTACEVAKFPEVTITTVLSPTS